MLVARSSQFLGVVRQITAQGTWVLSLVTLGEAPSDSTALMFLLFIGPTQAELGAVFPCPKEQFRLPNQFLHPHTLGHSC